MVPQYQVNLGTVDPLLMPTYSNTDYQLAIEKEMARLNAMKQQFAQNIQITQNNKNIWDDIDKEVSSLNNDQKLLLFQDQDYANIERNLQLLVQQELLNLVKDKISNSKEGKELLEKQLEIVKTKKEAIIKQSNQEIELFKQFKLAAQTNPNLTYVEFVESLNNK